MFDKLKQLSKDTAVYGVSTIVGRFLTFLLVPFYTNVFSTSDYGVVSNLYIFMAIFNVVFIYGMDAAFLKFGSNIIIGDEKDNFSTPYLSILAIAGIITLIIISLKSQIYYLLDVPAEFYKLIYYVAPILFIDAICVIPFIKLRLERKAKKFALFKIINILVNVILNLYLILGLRWGIEAIFFSNLIASATSFVLVFPSVLKYLKFSINKILLKRLLKFGLPYFPAGLAAMLIQGIDRPILTHLTDLSVTGLYSANYKLGIFMMLFVNMFQYAWQPFFLQTANDKDAKQVFSKVLTYFTLAASFVLVIVSLFVGDIARISIFGHTIIGKDYLGGLIIVPVILFGYMFNGLYVIFTAGIYIEEKSIYVPIMTAIGAVINIGVLFWLIPVSGIMGAALATLASYFVMAAGYFIVTQKIYRIEYEYKKVAKIFISIIIVAVIYYTQLLGGHLNLLNEFLMLLLFVLLLGVFNVGREEIIFLKKRYFSKNT